jgi:hypothetical protein
VLHFYGIGYQELLDMPIRCFWELSRNINRIQAHNDLRSMSIAMYSQGQEAALKYRERLEIEMGKVFEYSITHEDLKKEKLDRAGLAELKAVSGRT